MALYEFQQEDALRFKNEIGAKAKTRGNELEFLYCPYCHGGAKKDKGTFYINLTTGQFECKRSSCGAKGNMITLARDFDFELSENVSRYYNQNNYNSQFKTFKKKKYESKDEAVQYLLSRGISEEITRKYEVTVQTNNKNIMVFVFKDENEDIKFVKYRKLDYQKDRDTCKEWREKNTMPILFGMNHCEDFTTLVITEGQIDSLSLAEAGIKNAVSVPSGAQGFTWIPHCWDWVNKFENIVIFGDREGSTVTLMDMISKSFDKKVIKCVRIEDYRGCKDANEILQKHGKQALVKAVANAEPAPDEHIIDMADVEFVNIEGKEHMRTNIPEIDKLLYGLYFGSVVLVSGERGLGKSTFASQLLAEAIDQGYGSFIYSGELDNGNVKNWFYRQLAGPHVKCQLDHFGNEQYHISSSNIDQINNWIRGKVKMKDHRHIKNDEMCDVVTLAEKSIKKYGSRVLLIDNLMTAIDENSSQDEFKAQSQFVGRLKTLAQTYNVLIILIAHPRKTSSGQIQSIKNDEIAGSGNITNRVDVVMYYTREGKEGDEDYDESKRVLVVTKNRLTGRLTNSKKPINLYYNDASKRIAGADMNFSKEYGWNIDKDGFSPVPDDIADDLPF